ncbi:MAG: hypothetical protein JST00_43915 [Deltaproteobacteria bacterium]|nr:hypothetical protein [Deltaproteobacteria bacterium]
MIALVVALGVGVVSIPVALAARSTLRLVRGLGALDVELVGRAARAHPEKLGALAAAARTDAPASLVGRLAAAIDAPVDSRHDALLQRRLALSEAVSDVERAVAQDARVPRVAASLSATGGLFAAALTMREGLRTPIVEGVDPVPALLAVVERGLLLACIAVFASVVCATLHRCAQRSRTRQLAHLDELADHLDRWLEQRGTAAKAANE